MKKPLLNATRDKLEEFLDQKGWDWLVWYSGRKVFLRSPQATYVLGPNTARKLSSLLGKFADEVDKEPT